MSIPVCRPNGCQSITIANPSTAKTKPGPASYGDCFHGHAAAGNKHCQLYNRLIFGIKIVPSAAPSYIAEHNKFSPILLSVQTYQITILGPFRVLFCVREFMALDLQGLTTEPISQPQIPFLPGKYLCSAKNRINAKCRISLIVKLLYESHLQIL